ncbi:MAG: hypothetical protein LBM61_01395 [Prevotellaceae bacterium]|jgi:V/A-type H+-transporting ATPase subunit I|nr:hypothetical protein [Prevotellaceae bacterium]
MIAKMQKLTFLIYHKEYEDFLQHLRRLGVVHVETKQEGSLNSPELEEKLKLRNDLQTTEHYLSAYVDPAQKTETASPPTAVRGLAVVKDVERLKAEQEQWTVKLQNVQKDLEQMKPWGNFDFNLLNKIEEAGYRFFFYACPLKDFRPEWEEEYEAVIVNDTGTNVYFVIVSRSGQRLPLDLEQAHIPARSLSDLQREENENHTRIEDVRTQLAIIANTEMTSLHAAQQELESQIEFSEVALSGDSLAADKMLMLQGWVPEEKAQALTDFLEEGSYFYEREPVTAEDDVPILLHNNSFAKLFEPITRMYALPNYTELDPTPLFAPFFMLFFGLCMGDGGYGLIILAVCLALMKKVSPALRGILKLGAYMGGMTIVVGILTGCFFGVSLDSMEWGWLKGVKDYFVTEKNYAEDLGGYNPLMVFALAIGVVQILFGMGASVVKIAKQQGMKYAWARLSWLVAIVTLGITFGLPMLGISLGSLVYGCYALLAVCAVFIFFYNSPDKNIFVNVGLSLWDTFNMATGLLGDTLSYIRLFALGLTGGILGGVFNSLAFDLTASLPFVLKFFAVLLILLIGHSINFGLCIIASLVHPMRLTFVEFYKNEGFEGGGRAYKPFRA